MSSGLVLPHRHPGGLSPDLVAIVTVNVDLDVVLPVGVVDHRHHVGAGMVPLGKKTDVIVIVTMIVATAVIVRAVPRIGMLCDIRHFLPLLIRPS